MWTIYHLASSVGECGLAGFSLFVDYFFSGSNFLRTTSSARSVFILGFISSLASISSFLWRLLTSPSFSSASTSSSFCFRHRSFYNRSFLNRLLASFTFSSAIFVFISSIIYLRYINSPISLVRIKSVPPKNNSDNDANKNDYAC